MPQCDVSTEHSSSPRFERVANGHTVTLQTYEGTSSSTQCANLCLQTPSCSSFVLDVLSPSPSCSLHALATHTHAESNNVTGGSSSSLSSSSSNRWGSLREQVAVAVGVCREKEAYSLPEDDMPVLLGLDYFEKGVDIVNDTINRTKNIRLPVYTFHFEEGKNYFDPFSLVSYKVPDEVSMTVDEAGYEQIDSLYTDSYSSSVTETTKRYSYSVGIQMDFGASAPPSARTACPWPGGSVFMFVGLIPHVTTKHIYCDGFPQEMLGQESPTQTTSSGTTSTWKSTSV